MRWPSSWPQYHASLLRGADDFKVSAWIRLFTVYIFIITIFMLWFLFSMPCMLLLGLLSFCCFHRCHFLYFTVVFNLGYVGLETHTKYHSTSRSLELLILLLLTRGCGLMVRSFRSSSHLQVRELWIWVVPSPIIVRLVLCYTIVRFKVDEGQWPHVRASPLTSPLFFF